MSHGTLLVFEVTILVLAIFLGFEVISKVPTLLHTPLMSGTNAIHGIVVVGAMLVLGLGHKSPFTAGSSASSPSCSRSANVVGGFVVTDRMLEMFKKSEPAKQATRRRTARAHELNVSEPALPDHDRDASSWRCASSRSPRTRGAATRSARPAWSSRSSSTWLKTGGTSWWAIVIGMLRSAAASAPSRRAG